MITLVPVYSPGPERLGGTIKPSKARLQRIFLTASSTGPYSGSLVSSGTICW